MTTDKTFKLNIDSGFTGGKVDAVSSTGERVTLALQPSDVHDPTELPTYLAGFKPWMFRADEMSPPILVDNDSDKYRNFSSDDAFRRVDVKGSTSGAIPEVDPNTTLNTYSVVERFIGSFIPKQTQQQTGNSYDPVFAALRRCRWAVELDREIDVMTLLGTSTNFATTQRTAAGETWDAGTDPDPILDVQTAIEKSAQPVTDIWFNQKAAFAFLRNDKVRDHMRQMLGDSAVNAAVGNVANAGRENVDFLIPGFPPFHVVASKVKNETTAALDYVLGNVVVLTHVPSGVPTDGEDIATSYTFRRRGEAGVGFQTREFEIENRGPQGGTMVVVSMADDEVMTGNTVGGIITGILS